jgi:GAF domain-containing protein
MAQVHQGGIAMNGGIPEAVQLLKQEVNRLREENTHLEDENKTLRAYIQNISALYNATLKMASQDNLFKLLDEILYQALIITNAEHGSILLVDEDTGDLVFVLVHGDFRDDLQGYRLKKGQGLAGWVVEHGEPLIVNQPNFDPRFSKEVDTILGMTSQNILAVPMRLGAKIIGVIELVNKHSGDQFVESDTTLLLILAVFAAMSLDQLERQLASQEAA